MSDTTVINGHSIWNAIVNLRTYVVDYINDVYEFITKDFDFYLDRIPLGDVLNDILGWLGVNNLLDLIFGIIPIVVMLSIVKWGIDIFLG